MTTENGAVPVGPKKSRRLLPLFHTMDVDQVELALTTDKERGLGVEEAKRRQAQDGLNKLPEGHKINPFRLLLSHTVNFMAAVLLAAVILSLVVQHYIDAAVIAVIIVVNTVIGFSQEYRSEKTMEALMKMSAPSARVVRSGVAVVVPAVEVTVGDVVMLVEGDYVPADMRLTEVANLEVDEAPLTGESMPVKKNISRIQAPECPVGDRKNMAYSSTIVTKGHGKGICVLIAGNTEIGKIAASISKPKEGETPLQKRMNTLGKVLAVVACLAIVFVVCGRVVWGKGVLEGAASAIAVAVAIIPEGLVAIITFTMALGVQRMAKKRAIIRKLVALEALGNVTDICTDKTGTLTEGKMVATQISLMSGDVYEVTGQGLAPEGKIINKKTGIEPKISDIMDKVLLASCLCNQSSIYKDEEKGIWAGAGDPTEVALTVLAQKAGYSKVALKEMGYQGMGDCPFDSAIKRMSSLYKTSEKTLVFTKGAPERVFQCCSGVQVGEVSREPASDGHHDHIHSMYAEMASQGLRVLSLAYREVDQDEDLFTDGQLDRDKVDQKLIFLGLVGIQDPPRASVAESIDTCKAARITVRMLTGDHPLTAASIAKRVHIVDDSTPSKRIMTAVEFDPTVSDDEETDEGENIEADIGDPGTQPKQSRMKRLLNFVLRKNRKPKAIDPKTEKLKGKICVEDDEETPLVVARCSPTTKVKMIKLLRSKDRIMAMTGDGVNDAPAIKRADIGVAMGLSGSDVAKQSADIVLTDDNFSTIVGAVEEGRRIFENIQKFVLHLMAGNVAETIVLVITAFFPQSPEPLTPLQVLWLNMVTGLPPALGLGVEPASADVMRRKASAHRGLFSHGLVVDMFVYGTLMGVITLLFFYWIWEILNMSMAQAQTGAYGTLSILLLLHAFNCRHFRESQFPFSFFRNKFLVIAVGASFLSLIFTFYVPIVNSVVFGHPQPAWQTWVGMGVCSAVFVVASELYKLGKRLQYSRHVKKREERRRQKKLAMQEDTKMNTVPSTDVAVQIS